MTALANAESIAGSKIVGLRTRILRGPATRGYNHFLPAARYFACRLFTSQTMASLWGVGTE